MTSASAQRHPATTATTATLLCAALLTLTACSSSNGTSSGSEAGPADNASTGDATVLTGEILAEHPFDPRSFTQGLEVMPDGDLLVSTGLNGESRIYRAPVDDATSPTVSADLDERYFGEGATVHGDTVWQLTWKEGTAFKRDAGTLKVTDEASYNGEGWGICSDGDRLIMSDGSDTLTFRDPDTFKPAGTMDVTLDGQVVDQLNELECVGEGDKREVWANIWQQDRIVRIDPESGNVTGVLDIDLPAGQADSADVLNGIAAVPGQDDTFYLTGKLWDTLYEVQFSEE